MTIRVHRPLIAVALMFGLAAPATIQPQPSFAAGKTVKTKNLRSVPSSARPALMRAVQQLATQAGRPPPAAQDIPTSSEMELICGGDEWLVWWTEDENGNVEDGSVQAACGDGTEIKIP